MAGTIEKKLADLGIKLPKPAASRSGVAVSDT